MMDTHCDTLDELFRNLEEKKGDPNKCEEDLKEAREIMDEMKIELQSVSNKSKKDEYLVKIRQYQLKISSLEKEILTTSSSSLDGTRAPLSATEKNQQSLEILKKAHAQLAETEEVGVNVLSNLAKQKETIKHTQGNLRATNDQLTYSNKLLNRMGKWWRG